MKITNTTLGILAGTLVSLVVTVAALVALGRDPGQLVTFVGTLVVALPGILVAVNKSDKAEKNSAEAVHNTNGRMTELNTNQSEMLALLHAHGVPIPDKFKDITPSLPVAVIPPEYVGDEQGKPDHRA